MNTTLTLDDARIACSSGCPVTVDGANGAVIAVLEIPDGGFVVQVELFDDTGRTWHYPDRVTVNTVLVTRIRRDRCADGRNEVTGEAYTWYQMLHRKSPRCSDWTPGRLVTRTERDQWFREHDHIAHVLVQFTPVNL